MGAQESINKLVGVGLGAAGTAKHLSNQAKANEEAVAIKEEQKKLRELQGIRAAQGNLQDQTSLVKGINDLDKDIEGRQLPNGTWQEGLQDVAKEQQEAYLNEQEYQKNLPTNKAGRLIDPNTKKFLSEEKLNERLKAMRTSFKETEFELEAKMAQRDEFETRLALVRGEAEMINRYYGRSDQNIPTDNEQLEKYINSLKQNKDLKSINYAHAYKEAKKQGGSK